MAKNTKPSWLKRLFNSPHTLLVLLLALLLLTIVPLANNITKRRAVNQSIVALEREIAANEQKKTELQKLITYLNSPEFAEEQARLNLDLRRPGENVAVVRNDRLPPAEDNKVAALLSKPELKESSPAPMSNPAKWRRYFLHR